MIGEDALENVGLPSDTGLQLIGSIQEQQVQREESGRMRIRAMKEARKHRTLPQVTISSFTETGQAESSVKIPAQRAYTDRQPIISSSLASTSCASLGITKLLHRLNTTLGTSYTLSTPSMLSQLELCISNDYDFGTALGRLRPRWYSDPTTVQGELCTLEAQDREMRQKAIVDKRILTPSMPPRRVWDLYSNRVVPHWIIRREPWAISHAWMDPKDRVEVQTPINGYEWPVPIPKDASLELIRIEMLHLGAQYVWLDVLCLRQRGGPGERLRMDEWKLDVPTIGQVYHQNQMVVYYYSGLGRPFSLKAGDLESRRCWFNRAWTLQEISENSIFGGDTDSSPLKAVPIDDQGNFEDDVVTRFFEKLGSLKNIAQEVHNVFDALAHMRKRESEGAIDKIAGLAFLLRSKTIPAYYETQSVEDAWTGLANAMREKYRGDMLFSYPGPGDGNRKWRPSWNQILTMELPATGGVYLHEEVTRFHGFDIDRHDGYCIEKGYVRGLAVSDLQRAGRRGEMRVKDDTGRSHTFKIFATHQYPIPEASYTLISGALTDMEDWVVGQRLPDRRFEKVSVFRIIDRNETRRLKVGSSSAQVSQLFCLMRTRKIARYRAWGQGPGEAVTRRTDKFESSN